MQALAEKTTEHLMIYKNMVSFLTIGQLQTYTSLTEERIEGYSKWMSYYCLMSNEQYFSYIMGRMCYIRWDDNDVLFVLD